MKKQIQERESALSRKISPLEPFGMLKKARERERRDPNFKKGGKMACANCLACLANIDSLEDPLGEENEPIGCCKSCHSLICGHHGHRDHNVPEFICVICDLGLLAASATTMVTKQTELLNQAKELYYRHSLPSDRWRIKSLDDFERRRPGYDKEFFAEARKMSPIVHDDTPGVVKESISILREYEYAIQLLAVAYLIIHRYNISEKYIPGPLQQLLETVHWE